MIDSFPLPVLHIFFATYSEYQLLIDFILLVNTM